MAVRGRAVHKNHYPTLCAS